MDAQRNNKPKKSYGETKTTSVPPPSPTRSITKSRQNGNAPRNEQFTPKKALTVAHTLAIKNKRKKKKHHKKMVPHKKQKLKTKKSSGLKKQQQTLALCLHPLASCVLSTCKPLMMMDQLETVSAL